MAPGRAFHGIPLKFAWHCHCSRCRRGRSAAHASNLITTAGAVRFTRGAERLRDFKVPDARFSLHVFCQHCGSPMPRVDEARDSAVLPMGSLDDVPAVLPRRVRQQDAARASLFVPDLGQQLIPGQSRRRENCNRSLPIRSSGLPSARRRVWGSG